MDQEGIDPERWPKTNWRAFRAICNFVSGPAQNLGITTLGVFKRVFTYMRAQQEFHRPNLTSMNIDGLATSPHVPQRIRMRLFPITQFGSDARCGIRARCAHFVRQALYQITLYIRSNSTGIVTYFAWYRQYLRLHINRNLAIFREITWIQLTGITDNPLEQNRVSPENYFVLCVRSGLAPAKF